MSPGTGTDSDGVARIRERAVSAFEPLLRVDGEQYDRLFTLVLTLAVLWLVVRTVTSGWGWQTKLTPLIVGIPTLAMLLVLLTVQFSSRAAAFAGKWSAGDVLGMDKRVQEMQSMTDDSTDEDAGAGYTAFDAKADILAMCFWVSALFVMVILIGFTVGIPVYLIAYYRLRAEQSWGRTVGFTAITWAFIVVIFLYVLNTPLYPGLLGIEVPFLG